MARQKSRVDRAMDAAKEAKAWIRTWEADEGKLAGYVIGLRLAQVLPHDHPTDFGIRRLLGFSVRYQDSTDDSIKAYYDDIDRGWADGKKAGPADMD